MNRALNKFYYLRTMGNKKIVQKNISMKQRLRHIRGLVKSNVLHPEETQVTSQSTQSCTTTSVKASTSFQDACKNKIIICNDSSRLQISSLSNTSALSEICSCTDTVDTGESLSNIEQSNRSTKLCDKMYVTDNENVTNDDPAALSKSLTYNISENECMLESALNNEVDTDDDTENYVLHVDNNIDAGRLYSAEISGRCIVDFSFCLIAKAVHSLDRRMSFY